MNQKGIVIAGLGLLIGAILFLTLIAVLWVFWKALFVAGIGAVLIYLGILVIPNLVKGKDALPAIALTAGIGSLLIIISVAGVLPFSFLDIGERGGFPDSPISFETGNKTVSDANPLVFYTALGSEYRNGEPPLSGKLRAMIDDKVVYQSYIGSCQHPIGTPTPGWETCRHKNEIPIETLRIAGVGTGKQLVSWQWSGDNFGACQTMRYNPDPNARVETFCVGNVQEIWIDDPACSLGEGTVIVSEAFSAGKTVNIQEFRFPVKAFCSQTPILITEQDEIVAQNLEGYDILTKSHLTIPAGQTWTFFYVADISPELTVDCKVDPITGLPSQYNAETGNCEVSPGIVFACSAGNFDSEEGLCLVQPESRFKCERGYFDVVQDLCIFHIPEEQTSVICPGGSTVGVDDYGLDICTFKPTLVADCEKGTYDAETDTCQYLADTEIVFGLGLREIGLMLVVVAIFGTLMYYFLVVRKK